MIEWHESQKKPSINVRKLLEERIDKANLHSTHTAEEEKRLSKLDVIADKFKHGVNVQYR